MRGTRELDYICTSDTAQVLQNAANQRRHRGMFRTTDVSTAMGIAKSAVDRGAVFDGLATVKWDVASRCQDPQPLVLEGSARVKEAAWIPTHELAPRVEMQLRCRKCEACLRARAAEWRQRALAEMSAASRTWFATLTIRPEERWRIDYAALQRYPELGVEAVRSFRERHTVVCQELTRFLKRVRKNSGAPLRYLLVAESHKDGFPHYHALIHEVSPDKPVRHATLSAGWTFGFSQFKLTTDPKSAYYVTKYLTKSALARVRASARYGRSERSDIGEGNLQPCITSHLPKNL